METAATAAPQAYADNFAYEPTSQRERSIAAALGTIVTMASVFAEPFATMKLPTSAATIILLESLAIVALLLTGSTLIAQYRARQYVPLAVLGSAFTVLGIMHLAYILMLPGALSTSGLLGAGPQSAYWVLISSRVTFFVMVGIFIFAEWRHKHGQSMSLDSLRAVTIVMGVVVALTFVFTTVGKQALPQIVWHGHATKLFVYRIEPIVIALSLATLGALVIVCGFRTRVSIWLAVTVVTQIVEIITSDTFGGARFSLGWYLAKVEFGFGSFLFIIAIQMQLANILQRAVRSSTRAHTLFHLSSTARGSAGEANERLIETARKELDFEWGFITRFDQGRVTIETSVGTRPPDLDSRARTESSLLHGITGRELLIVENSSTQADGTTTHWGVFVSIPIFVDGVLHGSAGFASRRARRNRINDADRDFLYLVGMLAGTAIERDRRSARLTGLAYFDSLTGLCNRAQFQQRLAERLATGERFGTPFAVHFLDLDLFKSINDKHGHAVGDEVLCAVANRLRGTVDDGDVVARLGGDEFVILSKPDAADRDPLYLRICEAFEVPIATSAAQLSVGVSLGTAHYPSDGADADTLLSIADKAQYEEKKARRNSTGRYLPRARARVVPLERRKASGKT
jgi:diguanylate cyclase (GGDEF)-like protein